MSDDEAERSQVPETTREGRAPMMARLSLQLGFLSVLCAGGAFLSSSALGFGLVFVFASIVFAACGAVLGVAILFVKTWPARLRALAGIAFSCLAMLGVIWVISEAVATAGRMPPDVHGARAIRTVSMAEMAFQASCVLDMDGDGVGDYGTLDQLLDPPGDDPRPFIDEALATGHKDGCVITVTTTPGSGTAPPAFTCTATLDGPTEGSRSYFVDETGVIRFTTDGTPATKDSTPLR